MELLMMTQKWAHFMSLVYRYGFFIRGKIVIYSSFHLFCFKWDSYFFFFVYLFFGFLKSDNFMDAALRFFNRNWKEINRVRWVVCAKFDWINFKTTAISHFHCSFILLALWIFYKIYSTLSLQVSFQVSSHTLWFSLNCSNWWLNKFAFVYIEHKKQFKFENRFDIKIVIWYELNCSNWMRERKKSFILSAALKIECWSKR